MGAVVAGLYASGHDAVELQTMFADADWSSLVTGRADYRYKSFRDKEKQADYFSDYVAGIGENGLVFPSGVQSLRRMRLFLREKTSTVAGVSEFDALPTPFRAIATNLSDGSAAAFESGDIVSAMLASMAVPGLYPAVKIDDEVYVDGGMSKQVGIDVARSMGADVIIVIDTTIEPAKLEDPPSFAGAMQQLVQIQVWQNWKRQISLLTESDLHIRPDTKGLSTSAFQSVAAGYERGYNEATKHMERLRELAVQAAPPTRSQPPPKTEQITLAAIDVEDEADLKDSLLLGRLGIDAGAQTSEADIQDRLKHVESVGVFDSVDYILSPVEGGQRLELRTSKRSLGSDFAQLGARFSNTFDGDSSYELVGRWSRRPVNQFAGEISLAAAIGTNQAVLLEWFQPLSVNGRYYVSPSFQYEGRNFPIAVGALRINENRLQTFSGNLQIGRELGLWGVASVEGLLLRSRGRLRYQPLAITNIESFAEENAASAEYVVKYAGARARFAVDTLDSLDFPTSGIALNARLTYLSELSGEIDNADVKVADLELSGAGSVADIGVYAKIEGGWQSLDGNPATAFYLGGFKRVSGFDDLSLPATQYAMGRVEIYKRLTAAQRVTGFPIYVGGTIEYADIQFDSDFLEIDDGVFAGSVYGAVVTPLGPVYVAYGHAGGGRNAVYFLFGRAF